MDDLDHSISMAEYEWTSFYGECEECCLLLPSIADVENSNLSDSEESWKTLQCSKQDVLPTKEVQKQNEEIIKMVNNGVATNETLFAQRSDPNDAQCSTDDGAHEVFSDLQRDLQSDMVVATTIQEAKPLIRHRADLGVNDGQMQCTHNAEKARCGKDSCVFVREKERWFVTVNVSPLRRKRRKKKKPGRHLPPGGGLQKPTPERRSQIEANHSNEVEGGHASGPCETLQQHPGPPVAEPSDGIQTPDAKQTREDSPLSDSEWCSLQPSTPETCPLSEAALQSFPHDTLHAHSAKHVSQDNKSLQDTMPLQSHGCKTQANREYTEPYTEPALACLPVDQSDSLMLENNSTSAYNLMSQPSDSKPVELCSRTTDQLQSCDPTDFFVSDSPETYAGSLGHFRPVFAMSAFWDEMEKLTIRDILQLRLSGEQSSREALHFQDTAMPHDDDPDVQTDTIPRGRTVECLWSDPALVDPSDTADSDYFTSPDHSQPDRSSCDFSTFSDLDEECCQPLDGGGDLSADLLDTNLHMQSTAVSPSTPRQTAHVSGMQKSKSTHNVQALNGAHKDTPFEPILENGDESAAHINDLSMQVTPFIKVNDVLVDGTLSTILSNTDILDENYRMSFPEVFEYFLEENKADNDFRTVSVYGDQSLTSFCDCASSRYQRSEDGLLSIQASQWTEEKPIPIFTCSRHSVRDFTFPEVDYHTHPKELHVEPDVESDTLPVWAVPHAPCPGVHPVPSAAAADVAPFNNRCWSSCWNSWFFIRNVRFPDSGWCGRSGPWGLPIGAQWTTGRGANAVFTLTPQRRFAFFPHQLFRQPAADRQMLKHMPTSVSSSEKEGPFSSLKQSDMCLLCIAVASWVLRSTDPQAADSWKAALLANVSAISAIQYLRHFVLRNPAKDGP
ncbi:unnamed protein product [Lota lota]